MRQSSKKGIQKRQEVRQDSDVTHHSMTILGQASMQESEPRASKFHTVKLTILMPGATTAIG